MSKIINTKKAPAAIGPYSQAIEAKGTLYISGQLPLVAETMKFPGDGIKEQTLQSLNNIKYIVEEAGYNLADIVKCGIYLKDMNSFVDMNEVYTTFFKDHKPARFAVEVSRLPKDALVEIDAICVK